MARKPPESLQVPLELCTPEFGAAWAEWLGYRRRRRLTVNNFTMQRQLNEFESWGVDDAILAIDTAMTKGWQSAWRPSPRSKDRYDGLREFVDE